MPKVELHRHLEGAFHLETLFSLSKRNGVDVPRDFAGFKRAVQFPKDAEPDFLKFLSLFRNDWYSSMDDVAEITYQSVLHFREENLYYTELRFSPEHFALHNNFDRNEVTRTVIDAANSAAEEIGLEIRYLITFNRMKQSQEGMGVLYDQIRELRIPAIVGIDLAGDEKNYPPQLFVDFFNRVKRDGQYGITIHAGEVTEPAQIWAAIDDLHAMRIGHGTSSIQDKRLQKALIERNIALEQCLTSNHQTGSWIDVATHPMGELFRRGVPVTICSDDPFIQDADLTDDYALAHKNFGFTTDDFRLANLTALRCAFLPAAERVALIRGYEERFETFLSELKT